MRGNETKSREVFEAPFLEIAHNQILKKVLGTKNYRQLGDIKDNNKVDGKYFQYVPMASASKLTFVGVMRMELLRAILVVSENQYCREEKINAN